MNKQSWLDQAIQRHNPRVSVALAWSYELKLDPLDTNLMTRIATDINKISLS